MTANNVRAWLPTRFTKTLTHPDNGVDEVFVLEVVLAYPNLTVDGVLHVLSGSESVIKIIDRHVADWVFKVRTEKQYRVYQAEIKTSLIDAGFGELK